MAVWAHSCPQAGDPALSQPFGTTARPSPLALNLLMKGMNPGSPFASQEPLSWQSWALILGVREESNYQV